MPTNTTDFITTLKQQIQSLKTAPSVQQVGETVEVRDGIALLNGLSGALIFPAPNNMR